MNNIFDIVICLGPNDINIINLMIEYTKNNIIGFRNIYIISYDKNIKIKDCIIIDENIFPFNKKYIQYYIYPNNNLKEDRSGWYLQQLLKLYAIFIIDGILDNILILDADTIFFNKTIFFENEIPIYNYSDENHLPYYKHMNKLHPSLKKEDINKSGICHHMIMQRKVLLNLITLIENYHNKPFFEVFIENTNPNIISSASEYEIYFNYMIQYLPKDLFKIRKLTFSNEVRKFPISNSNSKYDYISYHWYL